MMTTILLFILAWLVQNAPPPQISPPVQCEFRAFDGADEVTRDTRITVYPGGQKKNGTPADKAGRVALLPGLYDVQLLRERDGRVIGIRWVEHLVIMRYPDEADRHVEVVNFKPQYGALELKVASQAAYEAAAYPAGDHARPVDSSRPGQGYLLLVVPAGRYDVRVKPTESNAAETWLTDIEVPADRTRLRTIGAGKQPAQYGAPCPTTPCVDAE